MTSPGAPLDPDALRRAFADLVARVARLESFTGLYVPDADLDKPRGGLKVHFDPRDWRGASCKGKLAKDCPPAFLDAYAGALQFMGENPKEQTPEALKKASYNRLDAARARSWARRLRMASTAPSAPSPLSPEAKRELFDDDRPSSDAGVFAEDGDGNDQDEDLFPEERETP